MYYRRSTTYIFFFFFNDTATTEIYTLSLHDALPISSEQAAPVGAADRALDVVFRMRHQAEHIDRKSTRLNSSHSQISYAVFCLKKKKKVSVLASQVAISNVLLSPAVCLGYLLCVHRG